jgi:hypothetical protein
MEILSYNKEYEASLKSIETENFIDKVFYRPIGFFMAKSLRNTGITPNMVTIISIFIGAAAGPLFYYNDLLLNLTGILCLVTANILDCVDGQLARLTGIKSKIGRILDGLAGDIWFTLIYVFLALRLKAEFGTGLFFIPAVLAGVSHQVQANITDYYKTLHLFFLSKEKGREFQSGEEVKKQYRKMKNGIDKVLFFFYMFYTSLQEKTTPQLQKMLFCFKNIYGEDIPENIRLRFRLQSKKIMTQFVDLMTFNGRTIVLFIVVLTGHVWFYFIYEIVVLNIVLALSVSKHERICSSFIKE